MSDNIIPKNAFKNIHIILNPIYLKIDKFYICFDWICSNLGTHVKQYILEYFVFQFSQNDQPIMSCQKLYRPATVTASGMLE